MLPEAIDWRIGFQLEGKRAWWCGRTSNSVGGVSRSRVGSTPTSFRHNSGYPLPFSLEPGRKDLAGI